MNNKLNEYVRQYGREALFDGQMLRDFLDPEHTESKYVNRLMLALQCGSLNNWLERAENSISAVELNTILINTVNLSGLKQRTVRTLLEDILTAAEISYPSNTLLGFDTETGAVSSVGCLYDVREAAQDLRLAEQFSQDGTDEGRKKAVDIYSTLAKRGDAEAMYMLGVMKRRELNSEEAYGRKLNAEDKKRLGDEAIRLLETSAADGYGKAKSELGDIYYERGNYDKAYEYYTAPGVVTVFPHTKEHVVNILNLRRANLIMIILGGLLTALLWMFLALNHVSAHNSFELLGLGIPVSVIATLIYASMLLVRFRFKYADLKPFLFAMAAVWAIFPLFAAIF